MPAHAARAADVPGAIAPDGIAIHFFDLPPAAYLGVAEGRIPPGRYGIHRHLSLEQYTYVVAGSLVIVTGDRHQADIGEQRTKAGPGALLLTLPGESLQFINEGTETARVLFICAPPYPADDADTVTLAAHRPPTDAERPLMIARLESVRLALNTQIDGRIAALLAG